MAKEILISAPEGNIHPKTGKRILSVTRQQLLQIFQECRSAETSLDPENRTAEDPSWFQCIATSMVVRDLFYSVAASQKLKVTSEKAKIWKDKHFPMRSEYNDVVHYLNFMKTTNGENKEIDFADEQFKALGLPEENGKTKAKPMQGDNEQMKIDVLYENCKLVNLPLDERIPLLLQRVKGKLALVLQEPLQKMGMSFDEYLVEHKLLLDEPLSLE